MEQNDPVVPYTIYVRMYILPWNAPLACPLPQFSSCELPSSKHFKFRAASGRRFGLSAGLEITNQLDR